MAIAKKTRKKATATVGKKTAGSSTRTRGGKGSDSEEGSGRSTSMGLEIDAEVLDFIAALNRFKKANNRQFPSWSEVLFVLKDLGYRKA